MRRVNPVCYFILAHSRSFLEVDNKQVKYKQIYQVAKSTVGKPEARKGDVNYQEDCNFKRMMRKRPDWETDCSDYLLLYNSLPPNLVTFVHDMQFRKGWAGTAHFCSARRDLGSWKAGDWNHLNISWHVWWFMLVASWDLIRAVARTSTHDLSVWLLGSHTA